MEFTFREKTELHYLKVNNMQGAKMGEIADKVIDADNLTIEVIKEPGAQKDTLQNSFRDLVES